MDREKKNKTIGMAVSLGLHTLLILLFLFIMAWREPNPPLPEYGIELNFGLDDAGYGDVQPVEEVVEEQQEVEETVEDVLQEETVEETVTEEAPEEIIEEEVIEETVTQDEGPAEVVEEKVVKPVETQKEKVEEEVKKPVTEPVEEKKEEKKEVNKNALYPGSQGNKPGNDGDQGSEKGSVDARALYGQQGGGGGPSLDMAGWNWDFVPRPKDTSKENGKIVFEIKVDTDGQLISVRVVESTVSPGVVKIYRDEVERLTFSPLSIAQRAASVSTGRITFLIRSR